MQELYWNSRDEDSTQLADTELPPGTGASAILPVSAKGELWPTPARAWSLLAILMATALFSYTDRQILSLLVDPIRRDLFVNDTQVALLGGLAFALVYGLAALPLGRLVDLRSRRLLLIAGVSCWSVATLGCAISVAYWQLFICRMFVGVGESVLMPSALSLIADAFAPKRRGLATGIFITAISTGASGAVMIGALVLNAAATGRFSAVPFINTMPSWRQVLALLGLMSAPLILMLALITEPTRKGVVADGTNSAFRDMRRYRRTAFPFIAVASSCAIGDYTMLSWLPVQLSRNFSLSPAEIGYLISLPAIVGSIAGPVIWGALSDARGKRGLAERVRVAAICMSLAVPFTLAGVLPNATALALCLGCWMFLSVSTVAMAMTLLQLLLPNNLRGVATSLCAFGSVVFGLGLGTVAASLLTDYVFHNPKSVGLSVTIIAAMAAIAGAFGLWRAFADVRRTESLHAESF